MKHLNGVLTVCFVAMGLWFGVDALEAQSSDDLPYALRRIHSAGVMDITLEDGDYLVNVMVWYPALNVVQDAGHDIYAGGYSGSVVDAHDLIKHFATAFLLTYLRNEETAAIALDPENVDRVDVEYRARGE